MRWNHIALALAFAGTYAFAQQGQTMTGTVSDTMCGKKHSMGGTNAECTRACVKEGADYALVVGDKVYTLKGDKGELDKLAGMQATVTGSVKGDTITATAIRPAQ